MCGTNIMFMPWQSLSWVLGHRSLEAIMHYWYWWMHFSTSFPMTSSSSTIILLHLFCWLQSASLEDAFASEQPTISKRLFMMIRKVSEVQWYCCQSDALYHDRQISWCVVIMEQISFQIPKDESVYSWYHLADSEHLSYFSRLNMWSAAPWLSKNTYSIMFIYE